MKYVLGIDLGTSGTKTVLFDQYGTAGWFGDEPCAYRGGICTADPTGGSRYDSRI